MNGRVCGNCDQHPYSPELGKKLRAAFAFFDTIPEVHVVYFCNQECYQVLLHVPNAEEDANIQGTVRFWKTVRESKHRKVFVGPERLVPAAKLLRADSYVVIPLVNAFGAYDETLRRIITEDAPGA